MQFISGDELGQTLKEDLFEICTNPHRVWKELWCREGITVSTTLDLVTGAEICKVEGILDFNASVLYALLLEAAHVCQWNEACCESRVVEDYDAHHSVVYDAYCTSLPGGAARDMVTFRIINASSDGNEFLIGYRSIEHPAVPKKDNCVRLGILIKVSPNLLRAVPFRMASHQSAGRSRTNACCTHLAK